MEVNSCGIIEGTVSAFLWWKSDSTALEIQRKDLRCLVTVHSKLPKQQPQGSVYAWVRCK
jgi:hypothetical protein